MAVLEWWDESDSEEAAEEGPKLNAKARRKAAREAARAAAAEADETFVAKEGVLEAATVPQKRKRNVAENGS